MFACAADFIPTFPLTASANGRFLVTPTGTPFPILGRVCWVAFNLQRDAYRFVFDDTLAKSFNAVEVKTPICPSVDNGSGKDQDGNLPFSLNLAGGAWDGVTVTGTGAADLTSPVEAFYVNNDIFLDAIASRNLFAFYYPLYVGYVGTDWWMTTMVANGATRCQTYGAYIANRMKARKNLVWMLGGDQGTGSNPFDTNQAAAVVGLTTGLKSVATASALYSAEWNSGSVTSDLYPSSINLNGTYPLYNTLGDTQNQGARAYAFSPTIPAFALETAYDQTGPDGTNTTPNATQPMFRVTAQGWFSTIGGYLFGNGIFTSFVDPTYLAHMNTQTTLDVARFNVLLKSIPWYTLVPTNGAITAGAGTANTDGQAVAVVNPDKSLLLAYIPPANGGPITIDMTQMRGSTTARWWDRSSGTYTAIASGIANTGTHVFTTPGSNTAGDADWLLRLDA